MKKQTNQHKHNHRKRVVLWTLGSIVALVIVVVLAFRLSPWPGAMVIRYVFTKNGAKQTEALEKHAPSTPITVLSNQQYRQHDKNALLDVYFPTSVQASPQKLPLIIWTHGGAWVSGDKTNDAVYFKLLAAEGYTVISADYTRGPEGHYPLAVHQLNDLYAFVQAKGADFHADTSKIFLAGDSAGSQLSSQMAALVTNPAYAAEMNIRPTLKREQLKGVILNCGIYKMDELIQPDPNLPKIVGWGTDVSVWAYTGHRNAHDPALKQMSAYYHVTKDFPATYITGGNGDPLTDAQSKPFADKLLSLGVTVDRLFYDKSHQPSLPHEYQFNLDNTDGKAALAATLSFIRSTLQ